MANIENVSDTARWVAVYRAMETVRPDATFRDPYAERLAGEHGVRIVEGMKRSRSMAWAMIVRIAVMDELILERIRQGTDTVLRLAAGLDARAWRMSLPADLHWIDVDLPVISEYKSSIMRDERPVCRYEAIAADLTDAAVRDALLDQIGRSARSLLVITEGLLIYLDESDVRSLARAVHALPSARRWITDIASPMLLEWMHKRWGKSVESGNAPFKFGPADSAAFFGSLGWHEAEYHSQMEEARRLKREMRLMWLWRIVGRFMSARRRAAAARMSGILLLQRIDS